MVEFLLWLICVLGLTFGLASVEVENRENKGRQTKERLEEEGS